MNRCTQDDESIDFRVLSFHAKETWRTDRRQWGQWGLITPTLGLVFEVCGLVAPPGDIFDQARVSCGATGIPREIINPSALLCWRDADRKTRREREP